jgi:hypothetical protein
MAAKHTTQPTVDQPSARGQSTFSLFELVAVLL